MGPGVKIELKREVKNDAMDVCTRPAGGRSLIWCGDSGDPGAQ